MPYKNIEDKRAQARRWAVAKRKSDSEFRKRSAASSRKWRQRNPEKVRLLKRRYHHANKERLKEHWKRKRDARKTKKASYDKAYRLRNAKRISARLKKWNRVNRQRQNAYCRGRRASDPQYAIKNNLRCRMNTAIRNAGLKRDRPLEQLIGCTIDFLMGYLEAQFKEGMSWANRKLWHIDHIRPCAKFDLTDPAEQARCFHYTNLQPLWRIDNLMKGAD